MILSYLELRHEWLIAGGSPRLADTMAAIGKAESAGDNTQHNAADPYGGSYCAWQINGVHPFFPQALTHDPYLCALAAVYVNHKQGLNAWSTHRSIHGHRPAYLAFMPRYKATALKKTVAHASHHSHRHFPSPATAPSPFQDIQFIGACFTVVLMFVYLMRLLGELGKLFAWGVTIQKRAIRRQQYRDAEALKKRKMPRSSRRQLALNSR